MSEEELGGCSSKNDLECNTEEEKDVKIEIKKSLRNNNYFG